MLEIYILNIILKFHYVQIMNMINKQEVDFQHGGFKELHAKFGAFKCLWTHAS
jgi:hypothetical protein